MDSLKKVLRFRRNASFPFFLILITVFFTVFGVFLMKADQRSAEYLPVTATVTDIETFRDADGDVTGNTYITYEVNGTEYNSIIGYSSSDDIGVTKEIRYNPENPEEIMAGDGSIYPFFFVAAALCLALAVFLYVRSVKKDKAYDEGNRRMEEGTFVSPNGAVSSDYEPTTEKKYYFTLDKKFATQGAYIEDKEREKVYEFLVENFTLFRAQDVTFANHLNGTRDTHKIGHTVTASGGSFTNSSSFSYDGKNVWDYLHENGVRIETRFNSDLLGFTYIVTLCGKPYGVVTSCSPKIHEEDCTGSFLEKLGSRGFYRITAYSDDVDLLFLTVFAFSRTEHTAER